MAGPRGMWDTRDSAHGTEPDRAGISNRGGQGEHPQSRGDACCASVTIHSHLCHSETRMPCFLPSNINEEV